MITTVEIDPAKLRQLRESRVLSLRELEKLSGVHRNTLYAIENGQRKRNHPATIRKLAASLNVEPHDLLREGK